ncbi:hypothetical protein ACNSOL_11960 (plasmid) [Aliarcobacter lanthieri]|uniref:hypothetical protein n=1 Tax=Aliarcobacter lanthieri TaxID=1355374 RepID=UPI003AAAE23B
MKIFLVIVFFISLLHSNDKIINNKMNTLKCLYPEISPQELLDAKELNIKEHIENLLYADIHKDKYFLKAVVLDYYYNANNIDNFYKKAYLNANPKEKDQIGLYYAFYLQRTGQFKEAISHLKGLGIVGSKSLNIPKKLAYLYEIFDVEKDVEANAYFRIKKISFDEIRDEINLCIE